VKVGPEGGHPVQVAVPLQVKEIVALAPGNDQEFFLPKALHLGKGMPEILPVPMDQSLVVVGHFFSGKIPLR
jgi:hypothetical protein